jgi:hypothetical protein
MVKGASSSLIVGKNMPNSLSFAIYFSGFVMLPVIVKLETGTFSTDFVKSGLISLNRRMIIFCCPV